MSIILNIDSSIETASVSIAKDGVIIDAIKNPIQKEHAGFLQPAIKELLAKSSLGLKQMDAIAVTIGPGSYTGLRVGLASAKGLCYALNKPLITIGTLNALALAAIHEIRENIQDYTLICPMIDARRMEVYTAVFDTEMKEILPPCAMILNSNTFGDMLKNNNILFVGNGSLKWSRLIESKSISTLNEIDMTIALGYLAYNRYLDRDFTDFTYSEPLYVKDFFSA